MGGATLSARGVAFELEVNWKSNMRNDIEKNN